MLVSLLAIYLVELSFHLNSSTAWTAPSGCHITHYASLKKTIKQLKMICKLKKKTTNSSLGKFDLPRFLVPGELDSEELEQEVDRRNTEEQPKPFLAQRYLLPYQPQRMAHSNRSDNRSCCRSSRIDHDESLKVNGNI